MIGLHFRRSIFCFATLLVVLSDQWSWGADFEFWSLNSGDLVRLNIDTGQLTRVGPTGIAEIASDAYGGLGYHTANDMLYGLFQPYGDGESESAGLYQLNRLTGLATRVGDVAPSTDTERFSAFTISPSGRAIARSIGATDASHSYYEIDLTSGHARVLAAANPTQFFVTDMAFDSSDRLLDVSKTNNTAELRSIAPDTGAHQVLGTVDAPISFDAALGYYPPDGQLYWFQNHRGFRTDPNTGITVALNLNGFGSLSGEYVGEFAPVPEPHASVLALISLSAIGIVRRKRDDCLRRK